MSENYLTEKDQNQLRNDVDLKMGLISTSEKLLFQIRKYEADIKKLKERIEQSNPICCHGYNSRTKPNPFDSTILVVNRLKITSKPMSGCFLKKSPDTNLSKYCFTFVTLWKLRAIFSLKMLKIVIGNFQERWKSKRNLIEKFTTTNKNLMWKIFTDCSVVNLFNSIFLGLKYLCHFTLSRHLKDKSSIVLLRAHLNAAEKRFRGELIEKWEEKVGYNRLDLHLCGSNCNVIMKYTFWGSKCNDNQFVFSYHFITYNIVNLNMI